MIEFKETKYGIEMTQDGDTYAGSLTNTNSGYESELYEVYVSFSAEDHRVIAAKLDELNQP